MINNKLVQVVPGAVLRPGKLGRTLAKIVGTFRGYFRTNLRFLEVSLGVNSYIMYM
jgi:hypothetical protein